MGKSNKAPGYATASYDTGGLFGSSTASKKGVTYNPTDYISQAGATSWQGLNNTLNSLASGDYSNDANYQVYANNLQNQMSQNYNNSVLNNIANRGLMRSSGLQSATNAFADTLANQTANLYDSYTNRLNNNLSNYQNVLGSLYNYITGVNTGAQNQANNVSNYNLAQSQANNQANAYNNALYSSLASSAAGIATSDIRAKQNVKKIGVRNGYNWYEFEYKDDYIKKYNLPKGKQYGVIAQEIEKVMPDAVITIDGIKHVDYNKLNIKE